MLTLTASARNAAASVPASDSVLLRDTTTENANPAQMLTKPPNIAEIAP